MNVSQRMAKAVVITAATAAVTVGVAPASFAASTSPAEHSAAVAEQATGTKGVATTPGPGTTLPQRSADKISTQAMTGERVTIGLPQTTDVAGLRAGTGTTVYPGAAPSTDLAVQATKGGGVRALAVLKDTRAPREQRYRIGLPDGARLLQRPTGAVTVVSAQGAVLGAFGAPWAKDAKGKPVATSYRIEGDVLIQNVSTGADTAFPVVADPEWLDKAAIGATAGMVGGCAAGAFAGGVGCIPGAVGSGIAGGIAGGISSLFG